MLYASLTWCARRALEWCYREVRVVGTIPAHGPVLLAVNHPNDLPDVCLVLGQIPRRVSFVANVSAAEQPLVGWVYRKMGVVPVHRVRDARKARARGEDSAQANAQAFARVRELLLEDGCVCVFPEGGVHRGPDLGTLRVGLARMALDARDVGQVRGLQIIPVGLTYESPGELRSRVLVEIGTPLAVDDWEADPARPADVQLTAAVRARLCDVTRIAPTPSAAGSLRSVAELTAARAGAAAGDDASNEPPLLAGSRAWRSILNPGERTTADALWGWLQTLGSPTRLLTGWSNVEREGTRCAAEAWRAPWAVLGLLLHAPAWLAIDWLARRTATVAEDVMARRILPGLYVMVTWYVVLLVGIWRAVRALASAGDLPLSPSATATAGALLLLVLLPTMGTVGVRWRDARVDRAAHDLLQRADPTLGARLAACATEHCASTFATNRSHPVP